ncbi:MAG: phosphotransferase, partial [Flavobacteriales bacterium]
MILFDQNTPVDDLNNYLKNRLNFLNKNEALIRTEIAGEGNMNVVMRLKTNQRSFILKQSRTFVRKYPDIRAPLNRID